MDFANLPIMQAMTKKMSWLSRRTEVIAENIAHAETPKYSARDLKTVNFHEAVEDEARRASVRTPRVTHALHLTGTKPNMPFGVQEAPDHYEVALDGNDVNLEQQLTRLGDTQMSYQATLNLYRKHLELIRTAIKRPGG